MRPPAHDFAAFVGQCSTGKGVVVAKGAVVSARADFGLSTNVAIVAFVGSGGLERPCHINTLPWKNGQPGDLVDAYEFVSGTAHGYLAFVLSSTGIWIIKSFKRNESPTQLVNRPLAALLPLLESMKKGKP